MTTDDHCVRMRALTARLITALPDEAVGVINRHPYLTLDTIARRLLEAIPSTISTVGERQGEAVAHALRSELGWLDDEDHLGEPRLRRQPFEALNGEKSIPLFATPPSVEAMPVNERKDAWAALRMVREAIGELFGPTASIESEEAVLLRGPEYHHEAEAIIDALRRVSPSVEAGWRTVLDELLTALKDVLSTGLNGGNNVRLAFIAAGGKELNDELLAKADASERAVEAARAAIARAAALPSAPTPEKEGDR